MRPTCADCALKHIAQASILLSEAHQGYPTHLFYALGHMAEAADELVKEYPVYAEMVRAERKMLEVDFDYSPDWERLLETIAAKCEICQLDPDAPKAGSVGRPSLFSRSVRDNQVVVETRGGPSIAWNRCELEHPLVQKKILSCVDQVEGQPGIVSPISVCRAAISCPG